MNHGSLFSGIGGFDLAAEWMGWKNVFHCEWNEFGQKILKYYWPNAISYGDITKTDFTIWRGRVDILTGGFPCQPYSMAGKRKGKEDERHLWPEMRRAIREIQPDWVVGENVPGIINWSGGLVFHEVQADLEAEGYEVFPVVLPACGVNAPHRRDRVWFVAHRSSQSIKSDVERGWEKCSNKRAKMGCINSADGSIGPSPDTKHRRKGRKIIKREWREYKQQGGEVWCEFITGCEKGDWSNFPTQSPLCGRNDGLSSRLDGITFSKWRNESIKAYGNAIVPQVAYQIFKAIKYVDNFSA